MTIYLQEISGTLNQIRKDGSGHYQSHSVVLLSTWKIANTRNSSNAIPDDLQASLCLVKNHTPVSRANSLTHTCIIIYIPELHTGIQLLHFGIERRNEEHHISRYPFPGSSQEDLLWVRSNLLLHNDGVKPATIIII